MQTVEPEFVAMAREAKALTLADACRDLGMTADDVAHIIDADRREIERMAGVRRGSQTTWLLVGNLLAGSVRSRCPWCLQGDPEGEFGPPKEYAHPGRCVR